MSVIFFMIFSLDVCMPVFCILSPVLTILCRESFGKIDGVLYPFVGIFTSAIFKDEVAGVVDVFEGGEDFAPFDEAVFVKRWAVVRFFCEVKGFVEVYVFDAMAALCKAFAGDVVFDKGIDAVRVSGVTDVDDYSEAVGVDGVDSLHVGFEGLGCLVFGGEDDIEAVGGVEEFGNGFGTVVFETKVGNVDRGTHFGGKADSGEGVFYDLFANGFVGIVIRQVEGAVD